MIIGKPHPPMFEIALEQLGTDAAATLMIGDRLDTDIAGAKALGLPTVLLLTGCASLSGPELPPPARERLAAFALEGRFSLRQGEQSYAGRLTWQHAGA